MKNKIREILLILKSDIVPIIIVSILIIFIPIIFLINNIEMELDELRVQFSALFTLLSSLGIVMWQISLMQVWINEDAEEYLRSIKNFFIFPRVIVAIIIFTVLTIPSLAYASSLNAIFLWDIIRCIVLWLFLSFITLLLSLVSRSITISAAIIYMYLFFNFMPFIRNSTWWLVLSAHNVGTMENFLNYYIYIFIISIVIIMICILYERKFYVIA